MLEKVSINKWRKFVENEMEGKESGQISIILIISYDTSDIAKLRRPAWKWRHLVLPFFLTDKDERKKNSMEYMGGRRREEEKIAYGLCGLKIFFLYW